MKKEIIGEIVHGWPDPHYFGIIVGYDYNDNKYSIYWINWEHNGNCRSFWYGSDEGPSSIENNIVKPS
jgi:hypothetical protein